MQAITVYYVDAFTNERFKGNPAAVCILEEAIEDRYLQLIAKEINLSETAFVQPLAGRAMCQGNTFSLRWFTPKCEVDLCGHATIATSEILFSCLGIEGDQIHYETRSGKLIACKTDKGISLNFPIDEFSPVEPPKDILAAMGIASYEQAIIGKNTKKLVICLKTHSEVITLSPNFEQMKNAECNLDVKGVGVTCSGNEEYDFISRYFNPWAGINEDPVTGSVHTVLAKYWGNVLNKVEMKAYQASDRGGEMILKILAENRVELIGQAVVVLKGEIFI